MLARAERSARNLDERPEPLLVEQRDALQSSLKTLQQDDEDYYRKLQRLRTEHDALDRRAIEALQANDEPTARRALELQAQVKQLKLHVTQARDILAEQLVASERTLELLQARIDGVARATTQHRTQQDGSQQRAPQQASSQPLPAEKERPSYPSGTAPYDFGPMESESTNRRVIPIERRRDEAPLPRATPTYPQDTQPKSNAPPAPYAAARQRPDEALDASVETSFDRDADSIFDDDVDGAFATFDAMERKIVEMEARAELSTWTTQRTLPTREPRSSQPPSATSAAGSSSPSRSNSRLSDANDDTLLADPLLRAFEDLEAERELERALEALKSGQPRVNDDALAILVKRLRGE